MNVTEEERVKYGIKTPAPRSRHSSHAPYDFSLRRDKSISRSLQPVIIRHHHQPTSAAHQSPSPIPPTITYSALYLITTATFHSPCITHTSPRQYVHVCLESQPFTTRPSAILFPFISPSSPPFHQAPLESRQRLISVKRYRPSRPSPPPFIPYLRRGFLRHV
ncbi:hypothetical protein E2C01_054700 [Portunus trituberculatus]|uniref:Uncharacterized protein n=1 Tax=Portunus trituberculatus TaxID=210409 RepID=A0A5B7GTE5_PORTR|nr:hypothetical protein [Portunus trituberculatus]